MATITTRKAPSRITYTGDINVNNGQLGLLTVVGAPVTPFNVAPAANVSQYFSGYDITFTASTAAYNIVLPVIGTGVQIGWKARFLITVPISSLTGVTGDSLQVLNIINSSAVNVYTFNFMVYNGSSTVTPNRVSVLVTAIGPGVNNWAIELDEPFVSQNGSALTYRGTNNSLQLKQLPIMTKIGLRIGTGVNINVLFASAVPLSFSTLFNGGINTCRDIQYYTFTSPSTQISFVVSGSYYVECAISLAAAGGATTTNCQFAVRRNGTTTFPAFCITQTSFGSYLYFIRSFITVSAGDFIEIIGGRSATTGGTLTTSTLLLTIICFGT